MKLFKHFNTITKHKVNVTILCIKCGIIKQGLLHDLSKYSWIEFSAGVKYYQGYRSPIEYEKECKGYSLGWLHHKGRNKHHWEYWLDNSKDGVKAIKMPSNYVVEMFCDRIVASKIYMKDKYNDSSAYNYLVNSKYHLLIHKDTYRLIQTLLKHVEDHGLDSTIKYIKTNKYNKNIDY